MFSASANSFFCIDLAVSNDHGIQYNELSTGDGHCVLGKRQS
jgi:hypothetical protein